MLQAELLAAVEDCGFEASLLGAEGAAALSMQASIGLSAEQAQRVQDELSSQLGVSQATADHLTGRIKASVRDAALSAALLADPVKSHRCTMTQPGPGRESCWTLCASTCRFSTWKRRTSAQVRCVSACLLLRHELVLTCRLCRHEGAHARAEVLGCQVCSGIRPQVACCPAVVLQSALRQLTPVCMQPARVPSCYGTLCDSALCALP